MITMDFRIIKFDCYETCLHYDIHQTCTFKYAYNYLQQPQKTENKTASRIPSLSNIIVNH